MTDEKLYNIYRYLVDVVGVDPEDSKMREFRSIIDHDSSDLLEKMNRIRKSANSFALYKNA